jgi:hypothetical protein
LLNIEINEFPELGLYASDAFDNKDEDEDSKLAIIDPFTNEKIQEASEDEDEDESIIISLGKLGFIQYLQSIIYHD